jgi:mannose-1-phosphate guanylyltransferase
VPSLRFHEKPNEDCARNYFESGRFLWNSGMFVFRLSTLLDAFGKYAPEYLSFFNKLNRTISFNQGETTANRVAPLFAPLPKKSIDFAVLEKAQNIFVVPSAFGWDDVGNYLAFDRLFPHDECNSVSVNAVPISVDSSNNIVIGTVSKKKILILGISNCIIVDSNDGLLVSSKTAVNKLKVALEKAK